MSTDKQSDLIADLKIDREEDSGANQRRWLAVVLLLAGIGGAAVVWWLIQPPDTKVWVEQTESIALSGDVMRSSDRGGSVLDASGYVVARRQATVSSKVTGKVIEVTIEEGDSVAAGDVMARLDDSVEQAAFDLAQAQLQSARAALNEVGVNLSNARRQSARVAGLAERNLASSAERDDATANVEALAARLQALTRDVTVAERNVAIRQQALDDTIIRAPFSGVVIAKAAQPGEMISPVSAGGGFTRTGIGTIVDMESLEIEVDVNEAFIDRVRADQPARARLDAYPDAPLDARVIAIVPTADRQKATVKVRLGFDERTDRVLPDMGVQVAFLSETSSADTTTANRSRERIVRVSNAVLLRNQANGSADLFVVVDGVLAQRRVDLQPTDGGYRVTQGLAAGASVVVRAEGPVQDGALVDVQTN